jgi:hypothetical protein
MHGYVLRLHVDDSQMEWVCEQHQKGKYLYTNACCNQVDIGLQRAFPTKLKHIDKTIRIRVYSLANQF